jgi:hypothetical protein
MCVAIGCDPALPGNANAPLVLRVIFERSLLDFEDELRTDYARVFELA